MRSQTEIRTTADAELTEQASAILEEAGYTLSDAVRMLLLCTVKEHALPFDPLIPNETTIQAMEAVRRGDAVKVGGLDNLFTDLHADDVRHELARKYYDQARRSC